MAVAYAGATIANDAKVATSVLAANNDSIALTPFSVSGTHTNQILILQVLSLNRDVGVTAGNEDPAIPTTIGITGTSPGTFQLIGTKYFRSRPTIGYTLAITYYCVINPTAVSGITVTVNMDRKSEILAARIDPYKNAYQGGVPTIIEWDDVAGSGNQSFGTGFEDADTAGAIIDLAWAYKQEFPTNSMTLAQTSSQTVLSTASSLTTKDSGNGSSGTSDGAMNLIFAYKLSPTATQQSNYTITTLATVVSGGVFSLELKPDTYVPEADDEVSASEACVNLVGSVFTGLDHLEGKEVIVLADGEVIEGRTVVSGELDPPLEHSYATVHVGLPYESDFITLPVELQQQTIQDRKCKISNITAMLINSRGGQVGIDEDGLNEVFTYNNLNKAYIEENSETMPTTAMFTGKIRVPLKSEYRKNARVMIRQGKPLPITVGFIIGELDVSGGVSGG